MKSIAVVAVFNHLTIPQIIAAGISTASILLFLDAISLMSVLSWRLQILSAILAALIVFLFGLLLCFLCDPSIIKSLQFGPSTNHLVKFTWEYWKFGFISAAIPQIPLSVLNSVIAICKLLADLFLEKEVSATAVSINVGIMNLVGRWFGAMSVCREDEQKLGQGAPRPAGGAPAPTRP